MYYYGFDPKYQTGLNWTRHDEQLVTMLFSRTITKTILRESSEDGNMQADGEVIDDMVNNLFDLCLFINKDMKQC